VSFFDTAREHGGWTRPVDTGVWTRPVNTGDGHGSWTRVSFFDTARAGTRPVNTGGGMDTAPWTRVVCTELKDDMQ